MKRKYLLNKLLLAVIAVFMTGGLPAVADDEIEEGWYYIKSRCYYNSGGVRGVDTEPLTGMTVQNGRLTWEAFENSEPAFIFKLEKAEDPDANSNYAYNANKFYVYNMNEASWYAGFGCTSTIKEGIPLFKQDSLNRKYLTFENNGSGEYYIRTQIQPALYSNVDNPEDQNKNQIFVMGLTRFNLRYNINYQYRGFVRREVAGRTDCVWTLEKVPEKELNAAQLKTTLRHANNLFNDNVLYTVGEEKLITNGTSTDYSGLGSQLYCPDYNQWEWWQKNGPLSNLIDGSITSIFLPREGSDMGKMSDIPVIPNFIQVDLSSDDQNGKQVQGVQLQLGVRGGTNRTAGSTLFPTDITIYGTNDETVAEDQDLNYLTDVAKDANWHKIGDYNFKPFLIETDDYYGQSSPKPTVVDPQPDGTYKNKYIVFPDGQKYRFLRFYVNNTTVNNRNRRMFEISELQLYELSDIKLPTAQAEALQRLRDLIADGNNKIQKGTEVSDADLTALQTAITAVEESANPARAELQALLDSIENARIHFSVGTTAGMHIDSLVTLYDNALAEAKAGVSAELSDAEYAQLIRNIRQTLKTAQSNTIPLSDGYYFITCAYTGFNRTKAMIGLPTQNILGWDDYDQTNPAEVFKITKTGEGQYSIQNVVTGKYINTIAGVSQEPTVTDTPVTPQTFTSIIDYPGQYNIANTENSIAYHTEFHQSGLNNKGYICTWNGGANSFSAWRLVQVTGLTLEDLLLQAETYRLNVLAQAELDTARTAYDQTFAYTTNYSTDDVTIGGLITNADDNDASNCQVRAQQEPYAVTDGYSSYANLIDGSTATCFQSTWQSSRATAPQYFQVDLKDHPVSDFKFLYGLRDGQWGAWEQWTDVTIYASNDATTATDESIVTLDQISSLSTWKEIGNYRLTEEQAIRNWSGSNRRIYIDVNHMGDKYRFVRFFVNKTHKPYPVADANAGVYNVGTYNIGEFQIYENTYDEANMPYTYEPGLKAVADSLRAQEQLVSEDLVTSSVTQDALDELIRLRKTVEAKTPVKGTLQALYQADSTYVSHFGTSDTYGDVTASEMTAIETALQNAKAVIDKQQPLRAELDEQTNALGEAFAAFKAAQKQFEPNKWYYIVGQDLTRQGSTENNGAAYTGDIDETFTYGNCAYAATDNTSDSGDGLGTDNRNALKWGYYVAGTSEGGSDGVDVYTGNLDPHTMWRFVPVENGEYAIQNRATGRFMTGYTSSTPLGLTADSAAYAFENLGSGQYKFRSANANIYMQFASNGLLTPRGNSNEPGSRWAFTLVPVVTDDDLVMEYPTENTISIKSLPYAVSNDILALNEGISEIYGIKGLEVVDGDSTLLLEKKTSIAAGESFILVCGDYTAYDSTNVATSNLILPAVEEFSFEPKTVNGLTAALDYTRAPKAGLGYFADNVLKSTTEGTGIEGHTGYFDVKNMPLFTTTTEADQRIPLSGSGVDAIKGITTGKDGVVNVYSIDGKLIKKDVTGTKATKGLQKGLYIVGKKKVSVK